MKKSKVVVRRLTRNKKDKMLGGVIGGLSEYFKFDSTIARLIWIAVVAFTGFVPGIIAYVIAMIVVPES